LFNWTALPPPFMSMPPRESEAKGTCEDVVTAPVPFALLMTST
jgi:hypothetical protein